MEIHIKKIKIISLILTMVLILTACGSSDKKGNNEGNASNKAEVTDNGQTDKNVSNDNSKNMENKDLSSDETQGAGDKNSDNSNGNKKVLVAYFSGTHDNLAKSTDGATWKDGQRFSSNATMDDIASWINDLEIISIIMTLRNIGFNDDEIKKYMELQLAGDDTEVVRLRLMKQNRNVLLDEIHSNEKCIEDIDYLRFKLTE